MPESPVTLTVRAESRPLRVAYLIDPDKDEEGLFDALLESAVERWGGRYRGFFPLINDEVPEPWWTVMETLDPDLVLSTRKLSTELVDKVTRRILPYRIQEMEIEAPQKPEGLWRIHHSDDGIDALGIPRVLAAEHRAGGGAILVYLHEEVGRSPDRRFILRNFGLLSKTVGARFAFEGLPNLPLDCTAMTGVEVLKQLCASRQGAITPIQLSALHAPIPYMSLADDHAHTGIHVVVGETMRDAMLAWNRALCVDSSRNDRTLWAPLPRFSVPDFLEAVVLWLRRAWWQTDEPAFVVSYAHSAAELEELAGRLRTAIGLQIRTRSLLPTEYFFPRVDREHRRGAAFRLSRSQANVIVEHVPFARGRGTIAVAAPPMRDTQFPQGEWMVDVLIPHRPELHLHEVGSEPVWTLPKRLGIGPSFFSTHEARVALNGLPSVKVDARTRRLELQIPSDRRLFWECMAPRQTIYGPHNEAEQEPLVEFDHSRVGQAVRGIIGLFGSVWSCGNTLSDPFWRAIFARLAGERTVVHADRRDKLQVVLEDHLGPAEPTSATSPELPELADKLARSLLETEPRRQWITLQELELSFNEIRQKGLASPSVVDDGNFWEVEESFGDRKKRELQEFLGLGVFYLGSALECPACGSTNWFTVEALRSRMACPGCSQDFGLDFDTMWSYRLNDLVANAFRRQGGLASLQALHNAENMCLEKPFVYLPPHGLELGSGESLEADLLCFYEGDFVIGEVKSQSRAFREKDFLRIGKLARALRPNKVWFAAPRRDWPPAVHRRIGELARELAALDVTVEIFQLGWWQMTGPSRIT